jgi:hypothetical protein
MLSLVLLSAIVLSITLLGIVMQSVAMFSVVLMSAVAPASEKRERSGDTLDTRQSKIEKEMSIS